MSIERDDLKNILCELSKAYPWFYSEASFRQELSTCISRYYNKKNVSCDVIQEYSFPTSPYESLDILVRFLDVDKKVLDCTAIELKYKTAACALKDKNGDFYLLKDQKAENIAMYLFWKDVHRLEYFSLLDDKLSNGYAIILTNEKGYCETNKKDNQRKDFEFDEKNWSDDNTLGGRLLSWRNKNGEASVKTGFEKPIQIEGNYKKDLEWKDYSILQDAKDDTGEKKRMRRSFPIL